GRVFHSEIELFHPVEPEAVTATYRNGVLDVTLPRRRGHRVRIKRGDGGAGEDAHGRDGPGRGGRRGGGAPPREGRAAHEAEGSPDGIRDLEQENGPRR